MKMTNNRKLILLALSQVGIDGSPPHSVSTLGYMFKDAFEFKWPGYEALKKIPSKQQIHRTIREMWHDGLIVGTRFKDEGCGQALPSWVVRYQVSSDVETNFIIQKCDDIHRKVKTAKFGFNLFGGVFDMGLPTEEVSVLAREVKSLLQKTHPDKVDGLGEQFKQMIECRDLIKSGIPLPTPTHTANDRGAKQQVLN